MTPNGNAPPGQLLDAGRSERGWHRIENMLRCPRLFALREIQGIQFDISPPLVNGSLIHIALAHHYQRQWERQNDGDPNLWLSPADAITALAQKREEESPLWVKAINQITEAYYAYSDNWSQEDWKVLEVENELRAQVGKGQHLYTQRADLTVEDVHGRIWIVDHKSCYRITSKTLRQHILDGQFLGYQMFGRAKYGDKFAGVLVNRIKLSAPFDFDRRSIEPAPSALSHFVQTIESAEERIAKYGENIESYPMALNNQTCFGKYGQCSAFTRCQFGI